jgi:hypothetical protein
MAAGARQECPGDSVRDRSRATSWAFLRATPSCASLDRRTLPAAAACRYQPPSAGLFLAQAAADPAAVCRPRL